MEVYALSKKQFTELMVKYEINDQTVEKNKDLAIISIADTSELMTGGYFKKEHGNVLRLRFDDVSEDLFDDDGEMQAKAFSGDQSRAVIDFLKKMDMPRVFLIQGAEGVSRSGAVAKFVVDFFGAAREVFKYDNPHIEPNQHVLNTLKKERDSIWK